jgi:hypothetical protein
MKSDTKISSELTDRRDRCYVPTSEKDSFKAQKRRATIAKTLSVRETRPPNSSALQTCWQIQNCASDDDREVLRFGFALVDKSVALFVCLVPEDR